MAKKAKPPSNAPGRGIPLTTEQIADFRAEYLRLGSVTAAANELGLNRKTCYKYADEADADPEFGKARNELLARGIPRVESMMLEGCELALGHLRKGPIKFNGVLYDSGPQYLRGLADCHRSLVARNKIDHDRDPGNKPQWPSGLRIIFDGTEKPESPTDPGPCQS